MPAQKSKDNNLKLLYRLFILTLLALSAMNLVIFKLNNRETIVYATTEPTSEYWESLIAKNPTYRDAYLVLASINKGRGDLDKAQELITKAKNIDPYWALEGL